MTTAMSKKADALYRPKTPAGVRKYAAIQARFRQLHDIDRKRIDDCIAAIMKEFYIDYEQTVWRILRTPLDMEASEPATSK